MKFNDAQYWQNIACIVWYYINAVVKPFSMYRFFLPVLSKYRQVFKVRFVHTCSSGIRFKNILHIKLL